jgi:hypothetical protein
VRLISIALLLPHPERKSSSTRNSPLAVRGPHMLLRSGTLARPSDTINVTESGPGPPTRNALLTPSNGSPPQSSCCATHRPTSPSPQLMTSPNSCYHRPLLTPAPHLRQPASPNTPTQQHLPTTHIATRQHTIPRTTPDGTTITFATIHHLSGNTLYTTKPNHYPRIISEGGTNHQNG